ncbi:mandelate racemase/muconate lactonizing enzyme family protein [Muricoccus vinaceus]|uniref:glucarate dehydratase n=1 Tax=Muricoccus vinaceus TaxID=424704 RepID=A0ABV6IRJ3_9PROT
MVQQESGSGVRIAGVVLRDGAVVVRALNGAEGACALPPGASTQGLAALAAGMAGQALADGPASGALLRWAALPAADRPLFGAVWTALHALRARVAGEDMHDARGGPAADPVLIETGAAPDTEPVQACLDPARRLVVATLATGGPEGVSELAALARACGVQLAVAPLAPGAVPLEQAARTAAALGVSLAAPELPALHGSTRGGCAVEEVRLHRVSLPLRDLYVSAMYLTDRQARTVVEIRTRDGTTGWGETVGAPEVAALAAKLAADWIGRDLRAERNALRRDFARIGFENRNGRNGLAAFAALELAGWDAVSRQDGRSLRAALGDGRRGGSVPIACPLPAAVPGRKVTRAELAAHMADPAQAARVGELAAGIAERWDVAAFKYKSAGTGQAWDLAALTALRRRLGPAARLRFDPNAAYETEEATRLCQALEPLELEFFEDPTDGIEGLARLSGAVSTPLATNMCVTQPEHIVAAARRGAPHIVLGDLFLWGGVAGLRDMASAARLCGLTPSIHSFYETGLATAANVQMALALGMDAPHPMDCGWPLLAEDIVAPDALRVEGGRLHCPDGPGLGLVPDPARLAALRLAEPVVIR